MVHWDTTLTRSSRFDASPLENFDALARAGTMRGVGRTLMKAFLKQIEALYILLFLSGLCVAVAMFAYLVVSN